MTKQEGWTWLVNSRKWHYFRNSRSLCGKFMLLGSMLDELVQGNNNSPDNCLICRRKREKEETEVLNLEQTAARVPLRGLE